MKSFASRSLQIVVASWLLLGAWSLAIAAEPPQPAQLKISGFGFFGDLRLKQMLTVLQPGKTRPEFFSASYIEDAALLLTSRLRNDGYLQPVITADLTLVDGRRISFVWDQNATQLLPRPLSVRKAHFKIDEGVLSYFDRLEFSGLEAIPEKKARRYFIETVGLFSLKQNRIYSPDKFDRGLRNLQEELQRMGFRDATVTAAQLERDDRTGKVDAVVQVKQGPQYIVDSVRLEVYFEDNAPVVVRTNRMSRAFSEWWKSDYAVGIKTNFYHFGYPDTAVEMKTLSQTSESNEVHLAMEAVVKTGPIVQTGTVELNGNQHTKESVLRRRVPLHEGDLLDRIKAERSRYRLSRLGVFDSVELKYEKVDEHTRNIIYDLKEGKRIGVSLLIGYGSYEQLRGGVQLDQYNVFGRAHHQQLKLTQSFKSSNADYLYTMPEFFGENVDVFLNGSGLRREEISFTRLEYGGGAGLRKYFRGVNTDMSMRYNYQILEANGAQTNFFQNSAQNSGVGAIITDINHDRRDNPLYPHRGYRFFSSIEIASEYLASEVNYQRLDLSLSYHLPVSESQWLHFGVSHGFVTTAGSASSNLPFNRRFFPGGENSVRGYQQGEAAPRDSDGKVVGADTYLQGNFEFEQGLTPQWAFVIFVDAVGFAQHITDYPMDEALFSVGGGIQWKTVIGPVRLEYGYNLNPRPDDPIGTLHFSLGFPF